MSIGLQDCVHSVRRRRQHPRTMYIARMYCPEPDCAEALVLEADDVMELVTALCECGCVLEIRGLPDWVEEPAATVTFPRRPQPLPLDLAA